MKLKTKIEYPKFISIIYHLTFIIPMILGLAPMDGFTDCAFRQITKEIFEQYGEKNRYELQLRTEFMNADGYIINPLGVVKHLLTSEEQEPVIAQIF